MKQIYKTLFNEAKVLIGDTRETLKTLPDKSVQTVITSPPYFGLRDYGVDGQIGAEATLNEYIGNLVSVFDEVFRVLKNNGTLWLNMGDSYAGSGMGAANYKAKKNYKQATNYGSHTPRGRDRNIYGFKPKQLMGVPWRVAFALQERGWILRQDIIWSKPNPMPESVTDRCVGSHEYIFLLVKQGKYYFNHEAIKEPVAERTLQRIKPKQDGTQQKPARYGGGKYTKYPDKFYRTKSGNAYDYKEMRNKRSVWSVSVARFQGAHFATFPINLIEPCVLAGSKQNDVVLDVFAGSGTTAAVALKHNRNAILCEMNEEYVNIMHDRIQKELS